MPRKDPEARKEYTRAYYLKNSEVIRKRAKDWYETHKTDPEFLEAKTTRNKRWREENREQYLAWRRDYRKRFVASPEVLERERAGRARWRESKAAIINGFVSQAKMEGCRVCGETDAVCLDLHHLDPATKLFSIGKTRYQKLSRPEEIEAEIAKCIPLCANCHRKVDSGLIPASALV